MKRVMIAVTFLALTLSLAGSSVASPHDLVVSSSTYPEACRAADRESNFDDVLEISDSLRELIIEYRKGWRQLCAGKGGGSIYPLYHLAKEIEKGFSEVFGKADRLVQEVKDKEGGKASFRKAEEIHFLLQSRYPSFVPLFKGAYIEHNYFEASLGEFRNYAPIGDAEDSLFFKEYFELRGETLFAPWILGTWDYGGCFRFGEYKWVDALNKIERLKGKLSRSLYREMVLDFEKDFKNVIKELGEGAERKRPICTCGNKDAVPKDLLDILENIEGRPGYEETGFALRKVLGAIEKNEVEIRSESEKHCSGG